MTLKFYQAKNSSDTCLIDFTELGIGNIENNKLSDYRELILTGLRNYHVHQKNPRFIWPGWVTGLQKLPYDNKQVIPPVLLNSSFKQWFPFTNLLSRDELLIDPTGMLTTSYGRWSLEFWLEIEGKILKYDGSYGNLAIARDHRSSFMNLKWSTPDFIFEAVIYGARTSVDEAVIDLKCEMINKSKNSGLIIAIRPYDNENLGGIKTIEYNKNDRIVAINGRRRIALNRDPSFVLTGNAHEGDIDITDKTDSFSTSCREEMASLAALFSLKKGGNSFNIRIALNESDNLKQGDYDFKSIREDFAEFVRIRITQGIDIKIHDKQAEKWFNISKIALLNSSDSSLFNNRGIIDPEKLFYLIYGYNRMGYSDESMHLVNKAIDCLSIQSKEISFIELINICYVISGFVDYFLHTRDLDYLQLNYNKKLKELGERLLSFTGRVKNLESLRTNSLKNSIIRNPELYDLVLISHTLGSFAYLARCLGIFSDEKKYVKEYERFQKIFTSHIENYGEKTFWGDNFTYDLAAGFPFPMDMLNSERTEEMIETVTEHFNGTKLVNRSYGIDTRASLILANNMLIQKDARVFEILDIMKKIGGECYMMPDFADPGKYTGCYGEGFSLTSSSMMFSLIRNMMFIDSLNRLDIFPVPNEEWFKSGREIVINNAPSRFGNINFRVKSTSNEIQFAFDDLPKYIPPDIMITLPVPVKLVDGEDFILKKSYNNSFIINGWPSLVRFIRKKR